MKEFFYGVIEGFYGREWSWHEREEYAGFLAQYAFNCYIYAPKGDHLLRSKWREFHSPEYWEKLLNLGKCYKEAGVRWGVGLSPLGLSEKYGVADRTQLKRKVEAINELKPDILCILFDDTRGDIDGLGARQVEITQDILSVSCADQHIVCPTYYSFDPVLEKVFGDMPEFYLEALGHGLDESVDIFWTGNKVISDQFTKNDLERVTRLLRRRPILWDNYPVNDGKVTSNYLHLKPYTGRPYQIRDWAAGHIVNPMNQPYLSRLVLQSLERVYRLNKEYDVEEAFEAGLKTFASGDLACALKEDLSRFQGQGLMSLSLAQKEKLKEHYQSFNEPVASEIVEWLAGGYEFDPLCLTD